MNDFVAAYQRALQRYADFTGRTSVGGYWRFVAVNVAISVVLNLLALSADIFGIVLFLYGLALIVPSRVEAFGIVALEAWRSGTALVMTDRGGATGFVRDGVDGILVDPLDAAALRGAIERVVADVDLRSVMVAAGRARVPEFTWRRVAEAYRVLHDAAVPVEGVPPASVGGRTVTGAA